ncbi:MAG: hypothetical protein QOG87_2683, partial [Actinomycetota bacterium]
MASTMGTRGTAKKAGAAKKRTAVVATSKNGGARSGNGAANGGGRDDAAMRDLLDALKGARSGDFSVRLPTRRTGVHGQVAAAFNDLMASNMKMAKELQRVGRVVGREGRMTERVELGQAGGPWAQSVQSINALIDDL